jgi:hypothetical protein
MMIDMLTAPGGPAVRFDPSNVPPALRQRPQWVCWKYIERNGKATKVPIDARSGRTASCTDPSTWATLEEAVQSSSMDTSLAGVGYVFSDDDPFAGIDLDDCLEDGLLVPAAREIVGWMGSYTEVSPSGRGVKIFIIGTKPDGAGCRSKAVEGFKEIEVYDQSRFFCVTGAHLDGTPGTVEERQKQLEALCGRLWPPKPKLGASPNGQHLDDDELIERACASRNGDRFRRLFDGDTSMHDGDDSAADLAFCNFLAFWTACDPERMDRLFRRSGLYREKWEREDYRTWTIQKAIEDCTDVYDPTGISHAVPGRGSTCDPESGRPEILISTDEHRVVSETVEALRADPGLFQRGSMLVRILHEGRTDQGIRRSEGSPTIAEAPPANLRERMTECATFRKLQRRGAGFDEVQAHPTSWLVAAVHQRGEWPGIRYLRGVSEVPILRSDGSICQTPGYDEQTRALYEPNEDFPPIPGDVDADDADAALQDLLEVVCDFPFEGEDHKAAWLAALLTPLARFAFIGPSPLFLIDANVQSAGKGLLAQTIGQIILGREMPVSSYAHRSEEMRKVITAIAVGGDRLILFDNVAGTLGNDALDRALTSTRWKDRILGRNEQVDLPLLPAWYATGNNVAVAADSARRIIHIRLDVLDEHPEQRSGFRHPDLLKWIAENRPRLLTGALTILSAYCKAARPRHNLTPFGSFEGWSGLVREAVVWVGLPDPCSTRARLAESADTTADALSQLIASWKQYDTDGNGIVVAQMLGELYPQGEHPPSDETSVAMRAALENLVGSPAGRSPTPRQIGNRLRAFRRRVVGGSFLDCNPAEQQRSGALWRLHRL